MSTGVKIVCVYANLGLAKMMQCTRIEVNLGLCTQATGGIDKASQETLTLHPKFPID